MLTARGSFVIGIGMFAVVIGIQWGKNSVALVGLSLLIWIWLEWLLFERMRMTAVGLTASGKRTIDGQAAPAITLVTERRYQVNVKLDVRALARGYRMAIQDTVHPILSPTGSTSWVSDSPGKPQHRNQSGSIRWTYHIQSAVCGRVGLPGLQIELSDHAGLFRTEQFIPVPQTLTILPFLIRPQTTTSVLKHNNLQRHLGHHRHRSSGISSELHGIRNYRIGDPPRTIAWKATARLGRLMTSEYENEVPIRATLLVDLARYQFEGRPGASAGDRAISAAASTAKLLLADRDPVAALLLSESVSRRIDHGGGERQMTRLLQFLLQASNPDPPLDHFYFRDLVQIVFENASRRFPDLFNERYNTGRAVFRWSGFSSGSSTAKRRALSVVLEQLLQLPCGESIRLQFDDDAMRHACLDYANRFSVVPSATSVAIDPPYRDVNQWIRSRNKMTLKLCEHLAQARQRAKDNELFVVIAPEPHDLLGGEMLEAAIKNTVAAKHRVIFIAPEPPLISGIVGDELAATILQRHTIESHRRAESRLGDQLNRMGVMFARIDDPRLMQLVSMEIGLLQSGKSRGQRSR